MPSSDRLSVEVHFVPLPIAERDERKQRLRGLLLRGALRIVQQHKDCNPDPAELADEEAVSLDVARK